MKEMLLGVKKNTDGLPPFGELVDGVRFMGEQTTVGFINGEQLATEIGLTTGTPQYSQEPWLYFELDGKTLYVAKKTYRYSTSWNQIHARGAVFGTSTVTINGLTYKVRLLTGANTNPSSAVGGYNPTDTELSEWDRLLHKVHDGLHSSTENTTPPGYWPVYSDTDLLIHGRSGSYSLCQETSASSSSQRAVRGYRGITYLSLVSSSGTGSSIGWRPVLELVG